MILMLAGLVLGALGGYQAAHEAGLPSYGVLLIAMFTGLFGATVGNMLSRMRL